ncbi:hypothetical protein ACFIOY_00835 [Bradyrhizobium sp. TZ2]
MADAPQHHHRSEQQSKGPAHVLPREKNQNMQVETGHNNRDFASNEPVSAPFSNSAVKKGNTPESMAALCR